MLKRRQCFEFCDQPWLTPSLREGFHDVLGFYHRWFQPYYHLVKPLAAWAEKTQAPALLGIASGNAADAAHILQAAAKQHVRLPKFTVSDLFLDASRYQQAQARLGEARLGYIAQPTSALQMPDTGIRHWVICTAFHHFPPPQAKAFLAEAINKSDGLCIMELTKRRWSDIVMMLLGLPLHLLVPFFADRFTWRKFALTTLVPVIPFMVVFDGVVSVLRTYKEEEIRRMVDSIPGGGAFEIKFHMARWRLGTLTSSMLTLTRRKNGEAI